MDNLAENFEDEVSQALDNYLLLGVKPEDLNAVLKKLCEKDLNKRLEELGGLPPER